MIPYTVAPAPAHICWDLPTFEGTVMPDDCPGCAEAVKNPCCFCGYGHVFATHSEAHAENYDPCYPMEGVDPDAWSDNPHIYPNVAVIRRVVAADDVTAELDMELYVYLAVHYYTSEVIAVALAMDELLGSLDGYAIVDWNNAFHKVDGIWRHRPIQSES